MPYVTFCIQPKIKTLRTNAFTAEVQTTQTIGSAAVTGSPETLATTGADPRAAPWLALALLLAGLAGARAARRRRRSGSTE